VTFPSKHKSGIEGGFTAAIQLVMNALASTDYPLQAVMNESTRVISVIRHQDAYAR
jgi:septum formation inhibitor-activating ATPase MinD